MSNAIPILLYHSVADDPSPPLERYTVSTRLMDEHAAVIAASGARIVGISELGAMMDSGTVGHRPTIAITFDDGFADTVENAAPILASHGLAATLYVTSGYVGSRCEWMGHLGRRPMASWGQLGELAAAGWEIGAHSLGHPQLDVLPRSVAREQIRGSRCALQEGLGLRIDSFAYPHGYHSRRVRQEVVDAGFSSACAVKNALSHPGDDVFALARITVTATMSADELGRILDGAAPGFGPVGAHQEIRTIAWRRYRQAHHRLNRLSPLSRSNGFTGARQQ